MEKERRSRNLTDEDIKRLATEIREQMRQSFFNDLGRGIWGFIWRAILGLCLVLAAWGATMDKHS